MIKSNYTQQDSRWRNQKFGVPGSNLTLSSHGCLIVAIANFSNITPDIIAKRVDYVPTANLIWASINKVEGFKFLWRQWDRNTQVIRDRYSKGQQCLIEIKNSRGNLHWLSVIKLVGNDFQVLDPWDGRVYTLKANQVRSSAFIEVKNDKKPVVEIKDVNKIFSDVCKKWDKKTHGWRFDDGNDFGRLRGMWNLNQKEGVLDLMFGEISSSREKVKNVNAEDIAVKETYISELEAEINNLKNEKKICESVSLNLQAELEATNETLRDRENKLAGQEPSKQLLQDIIARFTSRKFIVSITTALLYLLTPDIREPIQEIMPIILGYVGVEGVSDVANNFKLQKEK